MKILYSASTGAFYDPVIHGSNIPADAVEISKEQHAELLQIEYAGGKAISAGADGSPELKERPAPSKNDLLVMQIVELEATVTLRRLREAAIGIDGGWLKGVDDQIAALRKKMVKK